MTASEVTKYVPASVMLRRGVSRDVWALTCNQIPALLQ
jgi:hypothetical protein